MSKSKRKNFEAGFLLLEVLIALAILSVGIACTLRVLGQAVGTQRRLENISVGKDAAEKLLFQTATGNFPELFDSTGTQKSGEGYELTSEALEDSKIWYWINVRIQTADGRDIYQTRTLLRHEA